MMNMKRDTAILVTGASVILCACPGWVICAASLILMLVPSESASADAGLIQGLSSAMLCLGLGSTLIPAAVGFFTLRGSKPAIPTAGEAGEAEKEPIPPAI